MSSDTTSRPSKRPRSSSQRRDGSHDTSAVDSCSSGLPLDTLKRHAEFWMEDGTIVLVARDTAFRVYRGLLASQSTVFKDMLAASSPDAAELLEGCPVVRLYDSPEDLTHLLRALLPSTRRVYLGGHHDQLPTYDEVSAVVRLAHKYQIEDVERRALSAFQDDRTRYRALVDPLVPIRLSDDRRRGSEIGIVNIARLTDTPSLLPYALYECAVKLGGAVVEGFTREDGSVEYLSPDDLRRCIDGLPKLCKKAVSIFDIIFDDTASETCSRKSECSKALTRASSDVTLRGLSADPSILETWGELIREFVYDENICASCEEELLRRDQEQCRAAWDALPELFCLEIDGWGKA